MEKVENLDDPIKFTMFRMLLVAILNYFDTEKLKIGPKRDEISVKMGMWRGSKRGVNP